ncbi:MAG: hypothetical protein RLZZ175_473 [Bacteroidota bacterium]|jgi:polysaccharide export outer membrane protein
MFIRFIYLILICFAVSLTSCGILVQNNMFQTGKNQSDTLIKQAAVIESNYTITYSDQLEIKVYTNNGEKLIDPNQELQITSGTGGGANLQQSNPFHYQVMMDGTVTLPMLGAVNVVGYNMIQMDSILKVKYSKFYQDVFIMSRSVNRRVVVIGAGGGAGAAGGMMGGFTGQLTGQVIPLTNEKMNLIEVLALAGGLGSQSISSKILIIRGDLKNPIVYHIDLSTIEGMKQSQLFVQPNDIVYVDRQKKVVRQFFQELSPFMGVLSFGTTLLLLFTTLRK